VRANGLPYPSKAPLFAAVAEMKGVPPTPPHSYSTANCFCFMMFHLPVVAQNSELGLLPVASAAYISNFNSYCHFPFPLPYPFPFPLEWPKRAKGAGPKEKLANCSYDALAPSKTEWWGGVKGKAAEAERKTS